MAGAPRRHHFVTKAYLDGFLEPEETGLFCYGRKRPKPFITAPVNLAHIRDYHSVKRADGSLDFSLEALIEREFETPGIPVLRRLSAGKASLGLSQRLALASLTALQGVRVPYEREFMDRHNRESLLGYIQEMDEGTRRLGKPVNAIEVAISTSDKVPAPEAWHRIERKDVEALLRETQDDPRRFSGETFLSLARDVAEIYARMKWTLYLATGENRFITTDCPVVRTFRNGPKPGMDIRSADCEISFPLSSRALLQMKHDNWSLSDADKKRSTWKRRQGRICNSEIGVIQADDDSVRLFNECHVDHAHLWAFSGAFQDWLLARMQGSPKGLKRVKAVADTESLLQSGGRPPQLTRKRELVVEID
jgi:hypothetical protein